MSFLKTRRNSSFLDFWRHMMHVISCATASFAAVEYATGEHFLSRNIITTVTASLVCAVWYALIGEKEKP